MKQSSDNAQRKTDLLVVGAGPFGLAMAAYARHLGIEHLIVGKPMGFWKANMPKGMYLRSACDWHLDPLDIDTIEKFVATKGLSTKDVEPLSLEFYLSYARWFQEQKQISVLPTLVRKLDEHFQSGVPGMFITSLPAVQQFGPFFAFTIAVRASAKLIGQAISARADSRAGPPLMRRHD